MPTKSTPLANPGNRPSQPSPETQSVVPARPDQIIIPIRKPPVASTVSPVKKVAGENPPSMNLRDHPELNGKHIVITKAQFSQGDYGPFVILEAWPVPEKKTIADLKPEDCLIMITGSGNILERMAVATEKQAFPVEGDLRKSGRAWFLD